MNKKIFKRLLIATTMLSPVALITPMILTSCNENTNPTATDPNAIKLGNITDLFKARNSSDEGVNEKLLFKDVGNHFWLDSIDIKNDNLSTESQVQQLVNDLISNKQKLLFTLKGQNFKTSSLSTDGSKWEEINNDQILETSNQYLLNDILLEKSKENYSNTKNDVNNLTTVFKGVYLSNHIFNATDKTPNNSIGLILNGSSLNFSELLDKIDVECKIEIIDKDNPTNPESINDVYATNRFIIQYKFTPKKDKGFYWSGINGNNKDIPLIVTIKDNVDEIELINNLDQFNKDSQSDIMPFNGSAQIDAPTEQGKTFNIEYVGELLGVQGLTEIGQSGVAKPIESSSSEKVSEFLKGFNFKGKKTISGKEEESDAVFIPNNLNNAFFKKRIKVEIVKAEKIEASGSITDVNIDLKITLVSSINDRSIPDYEWKTLDIKENKNVLPIKMSLNVKPKSASK